MAVNLLGLDPAGMLAFLEGVGEKGFRARQLLRWIHQLGEGDFAAMTDVSLSLRARLAEIAVVEAPGLLREATATDGTRKWLLDVGAGNGIETVFIPEEGRGTLCVSSQVGCALGCTFCSTGKQGFNRDLTAAQILGQLWWANRALGRDPKGERVISNVVFMGMGEPLLNLDALLPALRLMLDDRAYGLSRRRVTVSTSGIVPGIDRLAEECPVALAVSLHAPDDALRDELVPINRKYPLAQLLAACRRYLEKAPRDFITFEYVLLEGVNDTLAHAAQLVRIGQEVSCKFNLIPFNPFPGSDYRRPSTLSVRRFQDALVQAGYVATVRRSRGGDIDGACGQLAGQVQERERRSARSPAAAPEAQEASW